MSDNVGYTEGAGTDIAADEIAAVKYQRIKVVLGADGVNDGDVESGNPMPVTGTVTANAGTNLNTSTLALEAGGNLAAAATSLAVIDDWDESDRAKVNPIVGQAGIQGGAGAVSATTQRVVLATDQTAIPVTQSGVWDEVGINDSGNSITVDNGGTFAVQVDGSALTSLQLIDDIVYTDDTSTHATGTSKGALIMAAAVPTDTAVNANDIGAVAMTIDRKLHVSVQDALPAGTAAIGKLAANDGVDIGDVTLNNASIAVTNGGTFAVQVDGSALTSLQLIDDVIAVLGTATYSETTTKAAVIGAVRRDADTTLVDTTNEIAPLQVNAGGQLKVEIFDGGESHTVDNAGTFAVQVDGSALTALQLIDDPVATLGTTTYTETTTKAMIVGGVRRDADTTLVDTTNEIAPLQINSAGQLKVEVFDGGDSHTVDNNGTFVTQIDGAALTSLQLIDDVVYTDDTSTHATGTSKGALIMAAATPTDTSVNANDIGAVGMTTDRRLYVDASGVAVPVTDNSGSLSVDWNGTQPVTGSGTATGALRVELANNGTGLVGLNAGSAAIGKLAANSGIDIGDVDVTSIVPGTGATNLGKAEDAGHTTGDTGVAVWQVRDDTLSVFSNAENDYEPFHSDVNGATWVHPTDSVVHDDADAGNGIKIACKAVATTSTQTLVAANDRTHLYADLDGTLLARNQVPLGDLLSERVSDTGGTSSAFTTFDNAAGKRNYITSVTVHNAHASTNGYVDLRDGTAGAVIWTFPLPATAGATHNFNPPLRQPTAATALAYDVSAAITTVYISINGFKSKL